MQCQSVITAHREHLQVTKHFLLHHLTSVGSWFYRFGREETKAGRDGTPWQSQPWPVQHTSVGQESDQHCSVTAGSVGFTTFAFHYESRSISAELRPPWLSHSQAVFQVLQVVGVSSGPLSRSHRRMHYQWEPQSCWLQDPSSRFQVGMRASTKPALLLRTNSSIDTELSVGRHQELLR